MMSLRSQPHFPAPFLRLVLRAFVLPALYVFLFSSCLFDNTPPDPSKYNDTRPRLVLSLTGFTPGARVYLRHWESANAFTYPADYALYTDASGRLLTEIVLSYGVTSADVLVHVDQSANGALDAADFGAWVAGIAVNTTGVYTNVAIPYQAATLTTYTTATPLPVSGQKICIYMPAAKPPWSGSLARSMPQYPFHLKNSTLGLEDWFPVSVVSTAAVTRTFPAITALGAGGYSETCVGDSNSNGKYDEGETVVTSGVNVP